MAVETNKSEDHQYDDIVKNWNSSSEKSNNTENVSSTTNVSINKYSPASQNEQQYTNIGIVIFISLVLITITIFLVRDKKKKNNLKKFESFPDINYQFQKKQNTLRELLKANAISKQAFEFKIKELTDKTTIQFNQRDYELKATKLREALETGLISEAEHNEALRNLQK